MQRATGSFPLPPRHKERLMAAGFETAGDLVGVKPSQLSRELGVSKEEALDILQTVLRKGETHRPRAAGVVTATAPVTVLELLQEEAVRGDVVSFCSALDSLLGGGFPTGAVTELCGAPGVGKTQIW
ncbi:DNA repair protein RAD51 homolog 3-like [Lampetra fluviatilis]